MGWQKKEFSGLDSWPTCSEPDVIQYLGMLFLSKLSNDPDFFGIAPISLDKVYEVPFFQFKWISVCQNIEEYIPVLLIGSDAPRKPMKN